MLYIDCKVIEQEGMSKSQNYVIINVILKKQNQNDKKEMKQSCH